MEFQGHDYRSNNAAEPEPNGPAARSAAARPSAAQHSGKKPGKISNNKWAKIGAGIFGLLLLLLVVGIIVGVASSDSDSESKAVDSTKLQAVFLETGQVYFGKITSIDEDTVDLRGIYYLQTATGSNGTTSTSAADTNVSLVKLGCELHAPSDRMIITRGQVTFWENLQTTGQVAKAVATFEKDNPNGQKCSDTATSDTTNVQGSTNTPAATTNKQQ